MQVLKAIAKHQSDTLADLRARLGRAGAAPGAGAGAGPGP